MSKVLFEQLVIALLEPHAYEHVGPQVGCHTCFKFLKFEVLVKRKLILPGPYRCWSLHYVSITLCYALDLLCDAQRSCYAFGLLFFGIYVAYGLCPCFTWFEVSQENKSQTEIGGLVWHCKTCYHKLQLHWGPIHSGSQVPSPTHLSNSQHRGKVPTCEPQVTTKIWLVIIKVGSWLFYEKNIRVTCSTQLATQLPSLTSNKYSHVGIHVILGI